MMASQAPGVRQSELWPFEEARKLSDRVRAFAAGRPVIFECGFGPSGLPHLGTMCEVLRPSYVRQAFELINPGRPTRLIIFIDDMDGLRKVPENVPNRDELAKHIGEPVSRIVDPFGCCNSFADHMISLLRKFLEPVEVSFELMRSSEMYSSGRFDDGLRLILEKHREIIAIIAPTLREENRAGWSPIMPLCPNCGQLNSTRVTAYHADRASVEFSCERSFGGARGCGFNGQQSVLGGHAKAGWKVDWALRWRVLEVDYELYGKDLIESARLSGQILRVLCGTPPLGFSFEMFLDEEHRKVSKSVGRGVTVDQWQRYAPIEVLKYFLMLDPRRARRLLLTAIPQYVDDYLDVLRGYPGLGDQRRESPPQFVLQGASSRRFASELTFGLIMHLVPALGTGDRELIRNYLRQYDPSIDADADTRAMVETLIGCALNFYADFIEPAKQPYAPSAGERDQVRALIEFLGANPNAAGDEIEKFIYEIGRRHYDKPGKVFPLMYRVILGQERGPRLGAFIRLATPERIARILNDALS